MSDIYKNDFELFIAHTDEKQVLLAELLNDVKRFNIKSILDIGAGNGAISIPLSKSVDTYTAVEKKSVFIDKLKKAGINTIEVEFPTLISETFDLVLSSHSISYKKETFAPFVNEAWKLVKPKGKLLIITYRGQEDDWNKLMKDIGKDLSSYNRLGYEDLQQLLKTLGIVETRKVITTVTTDSLEDMIAALSFVASNGIPELREEFMGKSEKLSEILNAKYYKEGRYIFPFQHFFIYTQKVT